MDPTIQKFLQKTEKAPLLLDSQVNKLVEGLRKEHGLTARFRTVDSPLESRYSSPRQLQDMGMSVEKPTEGLITSIPNREVILHEAGHALDPKFNRDVEVVRHATPIGNSAAFGTGIAAPIVGKKQTEESREENGHRGWQTLGGSVLIGAGSGYGVGKVIEGTENRANNFVKSYLTKELGSKELAEKTYQSSPLPEGRKTYSRGTRMMALGGVSNALSGAALGGLISLGLKKKQEEMPAAPALPKVAGLAKLAESGYVQDFVAGVDPTGVRNRWTELAEEAEKTANSGSFGFAKLAEVAPS